MSRRRLIYAGIWTGSFLALTFAQLPIAARGGQAVGARAQGAAPAGPAPQGGRAAAPPTVVSPEVLPDKRVVFRLYAPQATDVTLRGPGRGPAMVKNGDGVWETTYGPVAPGPYQYNFAVGGATVLDPNNQLVNETTTAVRSLLVVPGSEWADTKNVPHGTLAEVWYPSSVLGHERRMHVYTPPGYGGNTERYPVFYLLHGSGDSDQSWSAIGRANTILDNLIAAGKAKPMIVVMPFGHTRPGAPATPDSRTEFVREFMADILPFVEKNYRVRADRTSRAIAGLSMGGGQTLNIGIPHMDQFAYVGVFSAGLGGGGAGQPSAADAWEKDNASALDNASLRKSMKLVWFSTGKDDPAMAGTMNAVNLLKKHGFAPVFQESQGAHTWENWRDYLVIFSQQLFR